MREYEKETLDRVLNFNIEMKKKWEANRNPYAAFIELTPRCNFNCIHCYLQDYHAANEMSYNQIIDLLNLLDEKGILFLTFSGGEIFLRDDFLNIYKYAKKKGFLIELFSNGALIDDDIIEYFHRYPPLLVDISVYGACENTYEYVTGVKGAFEKVITNVKKLVDAGVRVSLKTPIIKETKTEISAIRKIADTIGVPFATSYEISRTIDCDSKTQMHQLDVEEMLRMEFEDFLARGTKSIEPDYEPTEDMFICNVAKGSFVIDYAGNLCPCMKFRHRGKAIRHGEFDEAWNSFAELHSLKASENSNCVDCEARYYCDFCPAEREFVLGDMERIDPKMCGYAKARHAFYKKHYTIDQTIRLYYKLIGKEDKNI